MAIELLVVAENRLFLADTISGALDDYERNWEGIYRRYMHSAIEPEYIGGVQIEFAEKFSAKEKPIAWQTLVGIETLPDEFTQAWLDSVIVKE